MPHAGSVWAAIADSAHAHRLILISTFILSTLTRGAMVLTGSFQAQLALTVLTEMFGAPIPIIGDATVMASVKEVRTPLDPQPMSGAACTAELPNGCLWPQRGSCPRNCIADCDVFGLIKAHS